MRAFLFLLSAALILTGLSGCETELPESGPSIQSRISKGLRGEGTLYTPSSETPSPFSNPSSGQ